jgi:hypothetical protein
MWRETRSKVFLALLIGFHFFSVAKIQTVSAQPIDIDIQTTSRKGQILSHVLRMINHSDSTFRGFIVIDSSEGIRTLSRDKREMLIAPGDSGFMSFKLLLTKDLMAGEKQIRYVLLNEANEAVASRETLLEIERREQLTLLTDGAPILITNPDDSVHIRLRINNIGNVTEQITLVFNVPNLQSAPPFTEVTASLVPGEQKEFTHSFIASNNLHDAGQFQVRITVMKGSEKRIVDTRTIIIQSISTRRSYNAFLGDQMTGQGDGSSDNAIQLSYRTYNNTSSTLQLQGGGYVDLPAGYLHLKGNIYKYNSQSKPYVTNTSLTYRLYENEFTFGNISEQAELSMYGRGTKILFSDSTHNKRLTIGAIDQNYNLLSTDDWFHNYYSLFIKGELGANSEKTATTAAYIFQQNPYELAQIHMASIAWRYRFKNQWEFEIKSHGSVGQYQHRTENKFTGAAELRYSGTLFSDLTLNGSSYYSDPYFSGNRKGVLSITQVVSKRLSDDMYLNGSFSYNKSEPKSYAYNYNYYSKNSFGSFSVSLPGLPFFTSSILYSYQHESSPSYSRYIGEGNIDQNLTIAAHRLGWQWRWQQPASGYSFFGTLEGGYYRNPVDKSRERQGKASLSYSNRWFTTGITWQQGAYYLYEQVMALQQEKEFTRFTASASVNHHFSKSFHLTSSLNFTHDVYQGDVPSVNMHMRYFARNNLSLYFSGYWYKYPFIQNMDIFNLEAGVRYQFRRGQPLSGKKSSLIAKVYYDHNGNSRYDKGDALAEGYLMDIDRKAFVSGNNGKIRYTSLPFGKYTIRPIQAGEWSFEPHEIDVSQFKTEVNIPLRQSGTLRGSINYLTGGNSVQIVQRYEGFRFTISDNSGKFRQTVVTDADGRFVTFLPVGEYTITFDERTLVEHTECREPVRNFRMETGKMNELEPFVMEVKTRKVNVKKFYAEETQ